MASSEIIVPVSEVVKDLTLTVVITGTGVRAFAFRCWLASKIMCLAAFVIGCGIEIKDQSNG